MTKSKRPGTLAVAALAVIAVSVVVLWRSASVMAVYPVERAYGLFSRHVATRVTGAFRAAEVSAENASLRREVDALRLRDGDLERLERENARLRQALGYAAQRKGTWLAAQVFARGIGASGDGAVLRIGKGSRDGVRKGAVVAVGAGLVGRIGSVAERSATVVPVTDPSVQVACEVPAAGGGFVRGILSGGDGDALEMKFLSGDASVAASAPVSTSGLGGVFPAGLRVGRISREKRSESGRREALLVESAVDFPSLRDVFVEVKEGE